ncbi:ABC transporter permease [Spirochaeta thermophila]|uniref:Putative membrane protein n=1 Tax=Winmispira thermophila (strain ATCC 49972 / DSM 6192 / RI 19.B1) TaxID=665571 RepID=E0RP84_WINT6|nr:ABC transporter permease [Spirochaeta thermophila]ADN01278.1 putative membrane protein [Spirochaeta thermophila DSM 6192]
MRGVYELAKVELSLFLREPVAVFFTFVFPSLLLVLYGAMFGSYEGYLEYEVPSLFAMVILTMGMMGIPSGIGQEKEEGVLKRLRMTPLPSWGYPVAWSVVYLVVTVLGGLLLYVVAMVGYGMRGPVNGVGFGVGFFLGALCFLMWGAVVGLVFRRARTASIVGMVCFFPQLFLSGATFPWDMVPPGLRAVGELFPMRHLVVVLQGAWRGEVGWGRAAWGLVVWCVVGFVGAVGAWLRVRGDER